MVTFHDPFQVEIEAATKSLAEVLSPEYLAVMKRIVKDYEYKADDDRSLADILEKTELYNEKSKEWLVEAEALVKLVREQTRHLAKSHEDAISAVSKSMNSSVNSGIDHLTELLSTKFEVVSTGTGLTNHLQTHAVLTREQITQSQLVQNELRIQKLQNEKLKKEENEKLKNKRLEKLKKKAALKAAAQKEQAERALNATLAALERLYQNPEAIEEESSEDELE